MVASPKQRAQIIQATRKAVRVLPAPVRPCSLAPAFTTAPYSTTIYKAFRQRLRRSFSKTLSENRQVEQHVGAGQLDQWQPVLRLLGPPSQVLLEFPPQWSWKAEEVHFALCGSLSH